MQRNLADYEGRHIRGSRQVLSYSLPSSCFYTSSRNVLISLTSGAELRMFPIVHRRLSSKEKDWSLLTEVLNSKSLALQGWPPHWAHPQTGTAVAGLPTPAWTEEETKYL